MATLYETCESCDGRGYTHTLAVADRNEADPPANEWCEYCDHRGYRLTHIGLQVEALIERKLAEHARDAERVVG